MVCHELCPGERTASADLNASKQVFAGLAANCSLTSLCIHSLQPAQVVELARVLEQQSHHQGCSPPAGLQQLQLPTVQLDAAAASALAAALCSGQTALTHLGLHKAVFVGACSCGGDGGGVRQQQRPTSAYSCLFTSTLADHPSLAHIDLHSASSCCCSWAALGRYVAAVQLQELSLAECALGTSGLQALAAGLLSGTGMAAADGARRQPSGLRLLDLSSNEAGPDALSALGRGLGLSCPHLHTLKLAYNALGSEGVLQLAESLTAGAGMHRSCCQLETLDLSFNSIKGEPESKAALLREGQCLRASPHDAWCQRLLPLLLSFRRHWLVPPADERCRQPLEHPGPHQQLSCRRRDAAAGSSSRHQSQLSGLTAAGRQLGVR